MAAIAPIPITEGRAGGSPTLFEIVDHLDALLHTVELCETDEQRQACQEDIEKFLNAEVRKVDNLAGYLAQCDAQQQCAAAEVKRLQERKKSWERKERIIRDYIAATMEALDKPRLEGRTATFTLRKSPASVEVLDQSLVPMEYIRTIVEESVDKDAAKRDLKAGIAIDGLRLVTDKKSVVIQ